MKLLLLNDVDTLKSTDNATIIEMAIADENNQFVDLQQFKTINVGIGYQGNLVNTESPVIDYENNSFAFTMSHSLPAGKYVIEVNLVHQDDTVSIAPNAGVFILTIEKSLGEVGETVTVISVQKLLNDMAAVRELAEKTSSDIVDAVTAANEAKEESTQATRIAQENTSTVNDALNIANEAKNESSNATKTANEAKVNAENVETVSNETRAIVEEIRVTANEANANTNIAVNDSLEAKNTANDAKATADNVRSEFDKIIKESGNVDAEVIQARGQFGSLPERLTAGELAVDEKARSTLEDAKSYTDEKVASIPPVDLSEYDKTVDIDNKDKATLQSAKDYTNAEISKIPPVDLSGYSTTQQVEAKNAEILQQAKQYTDNHVPVIDTSGFATKESVADVSNALALHQADIVTHGVYGTASGTNALTMTLSNVSAYVEGMLVAFKNTAANTGATTLNINSLGAKAIKKANGNALSSGNLKAGGIYQLRYDGVNFILLGEGGEYGTATASDVLVGKTIGTENGLLDGTYSNIKSIQNGETGISYPTTISISISRVDINKSILIFYYKNGTSGSSVNATEIAVRGALSADQITFYTQYRSDYIKTIYWQVIEFNGVKSKQSGTFTATRNGIEETITISAINPSKAFIVASNTAAGSEYSANRLNTAARIKNATTIGINSSAAGDITNWQVIEFY
ncbi:hypothetical protein [Rummeliibacillus stabekisii]|uniref:hypothetical protein n=1 Tax=Rummeliibacillus stabekisii TaxID=241244 RepID=UPI0037220071